MGDRITPSAIGPHDHGAHQRELRAAVADTMAHYDGRSRRLRKLKIPHILRSRLTHGFRNDAYALLRCHHPDCDLQLADFMRDIRFPDADSFVPTGVGGNTQVKVDATGNQIPFASKFTATLGGQYRTPLLGGELTADVNALYNDGFFTEVDEQRRQGDYLLLNASLCWVAPNKAYSVSLWGKNLANEAILLSQDGTVHATAASYQSPRTYGVTLGVKF